MINLHQYFHSKRFFYSFFNERTTKVEPYSRGDSSNDTLDIDCKIKGVVTHTHTHTYICAHYWATICPHIGAYPEIQFILYFQTSSLKSGTTRWWIGFFKNQSKRVKWLWWWHARDIFIIIITTIIKMVGSTNKMTNRYTSTHFQA